MSVAMDSVLGKNYMRPLAVHDTCAGFNFNIKNVNRSGFDIAWHEETSVERVYVHGADSWTIDGNTIVYNASTLCVRIVVWWIPQ